MHSSAECRHSESYINIGNAHSILQRAAHVQLLVNFKNANYAHRSSQLRPILWESYELMIY
jgi:hypothetical protein